MSRAAAGCLFCLALSAATPAQQRSNVLIILADDLGVDMVSCYGEGASPPPTPNIDALAARGVLFRNAWANPSCSPTRAGIMTGRYPFRTLVGRWIRIASNTEPIGTLLHREWTLPELLDRSGQGYSHACIGKWHLNQTSQGVNTPLSHGGWSHFTGTLEGQVQGYYNWPRIQGGVLQTSRVYATTQQTDDAITWIQQQQEPWVCYLAYTAPHLPFEAPPSHLHTQNLAGKSPSTHARDFYKSMIEALDSEIGRLFTTLGPTVMASTHVLFAGDNGSVQRTAIAPFNGSKAKGSPYEGGLNVPLIVAGPAVTVPGREEAALTTTVDLFATALEMAGAQSALPQWVATDSVSLVPYLASTTQQPLRAYVYSEEFTGKVWPAPNQNGHAVVRDARYKLIHRYTGGVDQLFDLVNDPWETTNLINRPSQQQVYAGLINEIGRLRSQPARFVAFGSNGCKGTNGTPTISAVGTPRIGGSYTVNLGGSAANASAILVFGASNTVWQGAKLPLSLRPFGSGPGCSLWTSIEWVMPLTTSTVGQASIPLRVPAQPSLVSQTLFHSWTILDRAAPANPAGIITTSGAAAVVGL